MKKSMIRAALCSTASLALPAFGASFVLPSQAAAQSVCTSLPGGLLECVDGLATTATGTVNAGTAIVSGPGLVATSAGDVIVNAAGNIVTAAPATPGISVLSLKDLTFDLLGDVSTTGAGSNAVILNALGDVDAQFDDISTAGLGSDALVATATGDLNIFTDTVATLQNDSGGLALSAANITAVCGSVATAGNNSIAINATAAAALNLTCATVQTTGGASDGVVLNGTDITADLGTITTDGIGSDALVATATGNLNITSDTIATLQDNSGGLVLSADNITTICGSVDTQGANSIGINATATGSIDLRCASVGTGGGGSTGIDVTAPGPITVVVGPVETGGGDSPGVVIGGGTQPVSVTCGAVITIGNNSPGVVVNAEGQVTVNCESVLTDGDNSDGIQIDGGAGPVSVTVGPVTTDGLDSDGIEVLTDTGNIDIVAGPVTVSGPGSDGISAVANGCADVDITANADVLSADGTAIFASSLCAVNVTTLAGASVTGAGAGIDVTSGTGATITLNDSVQATAGPAINVNGAAALINVNAGGSIVGRIDLTDNDDTVNNGGVVHVVGTSDFGAGLDVFNNLAGGTVSSTDGAGVLANCETFNNAGMISMIDGAANDTLTICGNYVGTGAASLGLDVGGGAGGLTADQLIIVGNASGSTTVNLAALPGSAVIDPDGVLVVDTGTSTTNAFTLGTTSNASPLVAYALEQRGEDYFLTTGLTAAAFNPLVVPEFATDLWYQSANEVFAQTTKPATTAGISVWGEGYISRDKYAGHDDIVTVAGTAYDVDNRTRTNRHGVQAGVDYGFDGVGRVGLTGGYAWAKADGSESADLKAKGWNIGLYGQFGGITGIHGEFLAKRDRYKADFRSGAFDGTDFRIRSTGIDGSLGYRVGMGSDGNVDVMAGVSRVRTKVGDIEAFGFNYDTSSMTSTRGRVGVRGTFGGSLAPYVAGTVYREFKGNGNVGLFDGANTYGLDTRGKGTWARVEGGLNGNDGSGPILAAWADFGDRKGLGLRAGFRFGGRMVEAAAPPSVVAPPPLPAPPATQTCSDGSVILATDSCPALPPPPPPPAPEPERG